MKLRFAVYRGKARLVVESAQALVKIGRDAKSDIQVEDESASRIHAVIEQRRDGTITLIDMGGAAGTRVNGVRVDKVNLTPGDRIEVGPDEYIELEAVGDEDPPGRIKLKPSNYHVLVGTKTSGRLDGGRVLCRLWREVAPYPKLVWCSELHTDVLPEDVLEPIEVQGEGEKVRRVLVMASDGLMEVHPVKVFEKLSRI